MGLWPGDCGLRPVPSRQPVMNDTFRTQVLGPRQAEFVLLLAGRIVPESAAATPDVRRGLVAIIDGMLERQPRSQQLQFKLLLFALRWMTVPFTLHRLEKLPAGWQDFLLRRLEGAPLTILRVGIWGLKTLVFMGYYGQQGVIAQIHYDPSKTDGNGVLSEMRRRTER